MFCGIFDVYIKNDHNKIINENIFKLLDKLKKTEVHQIHLLSLTDIKINITYNSWNINTIKSY